MSLLNQHLDQPANVKLLFNIGALLDIPTGRYLIGPHGESILLGGLGMMTGMVGGGNSFKSTICHYMMLSAANRIMDTTETTMSTYDTEINIHEDRLREFSTRFHNFADRDILEDGTWVITDKTVYFANEWYAKTKEFLKSKIDNSKKLMVSTPFLSRDSKTLLEVIVPTFGECDSLSEFETEEVSEIQDKNELGTSGGNTIHMKAGLDKTRFLMDIPKLLGSSNHFMFFTCHFGKDINMASGPYAPQPQKKLQHMKAGENFKGVPPKFDFLMSNCWHSCHSALLINQSTKGPEYPKDSGDNSAGDMDLNIVTLRQLRSKSGPSGITIDIIVSQREGILPTLTEFHYIKSKDRFGMSGSLQSYSLDLYPDVKIARTTVRGKIVSDPLLCRAINITSELCQMHEHYRYLQDKLVTPKEIYDYLKENNYDIEMILSRTRGWWALNDANHPSLYFLSTLDLCKLVKGIYKIFWLEDDNRTIKPEYLKK